MAFADLILTEDLPLGVESPEMYARCICKSANLTEIRILYIGLICVMAG